VHRDLVGFEVRRGQPSCREALVLDSGRHLLAGLPQRDDDDLAGGGVGKQVEAVEPGAGWFRAELRLSAAKRAQLHDLLLAAIEPATDLREAQRQAARLLGSIELD
jgi:hypothetical protein